MARRPSRTVTLSAGELDELYAARRYFGVKPSRKLALQVPFEIYLQDPLVARRDPTLAFDAEHFVDWEHGLGDGPTSARFAVVDFDADTDRVQPPARCDADRKLFVGVGGEALGSHAPDVPQFHQVLLWAVLQRALRYFEEPAGLGRPIPWGFEGHRLIVVPHAGYGENAYYDRESKSLQFYYFDVEDRDAPGGTRRVHTCLSADIVHHEFAHAVLDGVRPLLIENASIESAAFHEAVGDITAVLMALRNNTLRRKLADATEGDMSAAEQVAAIAEEFGRGVSDKPYLRSAKNTLTVDDVAGSRSPHHVSQVLTGAVFDILTRITPKYLSRRRTPAQAFWHAAERMQRMAVQPLDLLAPVDVTFADYARAMLRAEQLANPLDPRGYRADMLDAFAGRGVLSARDREDLGEPKYLFERLKLDVFHPIERIASSEAAAYRFLDDNRKALGLPRNRDIVVADLYTTEKQTRQANRLPRQIVLQYVWREDAPLDGREKYGRFHGHRASLLCGGTLVFDEQGNLQHRCHKGGVDTDPARRERQLADIARSLRAGQVGDAHGSPRGLLGTRMPLLTSREVDGSLRFELTPHLHLCEHHRHAEGERQWEISS